MPHERCNREGKIVLMAEVFIGIGSNMGKRQSNIARAVEQLSACGKIKLMSSLFETEPEGYKDQIDFLNCVVSIDTDTGADELLNILKDIENAAGRKPSFRNAPRPLDLDILFYGNQIIKKEALEIPHPRLHERSFVLVPLAEVAPFLQHPILHKTVQQMLSELSMGKRINRWGSLEVHLARS
ncbi:MAG: 2-amino-4-hydroxy-6-hydroxymethyldihydropteridine diphosphokinase [Dehalococcoidia bacterium]|nr:2-amino-4-hydroxy-6-hydroxymethyldihydropteridine diphosphokinase [Dehalococcoidia bacterium]